MQGAQRRASVTAAAAHTVALLAGSAFVASILALSARAAGRLPASGAALACALAALALAMRLPVPGSRWMVPREWARLGTTAYPAAFGFALGTGVMTLLPSAALYALFAIAQAAPWWQTYVLLLVFGAARSALVLLLTARSTTRTARAQASLDAVRDRMARLDIVEIALLAGLSAQLLRT